MLNAAMTRLAKGSLIYGVGGMLQRFMGLLLMPFFTNTLTPQDYGVMALISLVQVAMSGLFSLGTGSSMGVLYYRESDISRRSTIVWSNSLLLALNGAFWYSVVFLAAPMLSTVMFQVDRYADLIRLSLLGSVLSTIADPLLAYLRMEEKAKRYVALTLVSSLLSIGFSIWFVLIQEVGVKGVILAGTLAQGIMLGVNLLVIGSKLHFNIELPLFSKLIRIGFPSIFGLFAFLLIDYADRQMIERMLSLDALGVYSVGYSFGMVMVIPMGAFATAWPQFFMSYINKQDEARVVFSRVLTYYLIGFSLLVVSFFFVAKPVVHMLTARAFHDAHLVVGLVAAAYMLKGCYLIVLPGIYFAEKLHKQSAIEWCAAIINIGLNLWLIPLFGIVGAALATFVSYLTLPVLAWLVARSYLAVDYEWRRITLTSILLFVACGLLFFISVVDSEGLMLSTILGFLVVMCFLVLIYWLVLTSSERSKRWGVRV